MEDVLEVQELIYSLTQRVEELERGVPESHFILNEAVNSIWFFVAVAELVSMNIGFAMREAGLVRERSMVTTYTKNLLCMAQSAVMAYLITYDIAYSEHPGSYDPLHTRDWNDHRVRRQKVFHLMAQTMVCSIISGAMAERTSVIGSFVLNAFAVFIHAGAVRYTWGHRNFEWLPAPYVDIAGAGVVHLIGGAIALVGALMVGPRTGRWLPEEKGSFVPHSLSLTSIGMMLVWCGWFGFIFVSQAEGNALINVSKLSIGAVNATVGAASAGLTAVLLSIARSPEHMPQMLKLCNAVLAGLVATSGGIDVIALRYACIVGSLSAVLARGGEKLLKHLEIDDVSDACAIHGVSGALGVLSVGVFHHSQGLVASGSGDLLLTQCLGVLMLAGWATALGAFALCAMDCVGLLRVSQLVESEGLDKTLGFEAYVRCSEEMGLLQQAGGILERCGHSPEDVVVTLNHLRRIISRPFTPSASSARKKGEVDDILEQLDLSDFSGGTNHFMFLVYDHSHAKDIAEDFAARVEDLLAKHYGLSPRHTGHHNTLVSQRDHGNANEDIHPHLAAIDKSHAVIILLTRNIYADPWSIAEIVHANAGKKRILGVQIELEELELDPRYFRFPRDIAHVAAQWQSVIEEMGDAVGHERSTTSSISKRSSIRRRRRSFAFQSFHSSDAASRRSSRASIQLHEAYATAGGGVGVADEFDDVVCASGSTVSNDVICNLEDISVHVICDTDSSDLVIFDADDEEPDTVVFGV